MIFDSDTKFRLNNLEIRVQCNLINCHRANCFRYTRDRTRKKSRIQGRVGLLFVRKNDKEEGADNTDEKKEDNIDDNRDDSAQNYG